LKLFGRFLLSRVLITHEFSRARRNRGERRSAVILPTGRLTTPILVNVNEIACHNLYEPSSRFNPGGQTNDSLSSKFSTDLTAFPKFFFLFF
jgi:hypothetical protein